MCDDVVGWVLITLSYCTCLLHERKTDSLTHFAELLRDEPCDEVNFLMFWNDTEVLTYLPQNHDDSGWAVLRK